MKKLKLQILFTDLLVLFCERFLNLQYDDIKDSIIIFLNEYGDVDDIFTSFVSGDYPFN